MLVVTFRMKRLFFTLFSLVLGLQAFAQYGNEWVKFNQPYYRISVAKDGLYRLTYTDLQNAGFPVASTNPLQIQVFHRGIEQAIRLPGEVDGVFDAGDYLEFYGLKNTGAGDTELYKPGMQPHAYYNLYSDTTAYFLTINSLAQPGLRMNSFSEENTGLPAESFHTDEKLMVITDQYSPGIRYGVESLIQTTGFETGEGWTGTLLASGGFSEYVFTDIVNTAPASGNPVMEVQVVGREAENYQVEILVGPTAASRSFAIQAASEFETATITGTLNWSDIGADGKLVVRVRSVSGRVSASYIKITYPQTLNAAGASEKIFILNTNAGNKSYIEIQNPAANTRLFDITDPDHVSIIGSAGAAPLTAVINNTSSSRRILATSAFLTPPVKRVNFRNMNPAAEYIIISNKALMKPAAPYPDVVKAYATYRASPEGGAYDTLVVDMDQLYNQFNYGEISPLAITRFMRYMVDTGNPKYLFLIGKGLDVAFGYHRNPSGFTLRDLVPTAGMPASDIFFTAGLAGNGFEPAVPTGRITANTPPEVAAYLNKVKEMEALPFDALWRKNLLHLSGGLKAGEPEEFRSYLQQLEPMATGYYLGGKVTAISKSNTGDDIFNISEHVNKGLNLVTLFGHSSSSQNDVNIGFVSAPDLGYANAGKYPMFLINGCNAGDFFTTTTRYGEDWINTASKGAVGFMANTSFGYSSYLLEYSQAFYSIGYADSVFIHKGVGEIQKEVVRQTTDNNSSLEMTTQSQQMLLLGDPAVALFGANKPDYEINDTHVYTESYSVEPITALSDSFALKIVVRNFGRAREDTLEVSVTRTLSDNSLITYDSTFLPVLYTDTLTINVPRDNKGYGSTTFTVTLDPLNKAVELNEDNNTAQLSVLIPLNAARGLYPQGFAIVNSLSTNLVVQSSNLLDDARDFIIQLDTVDTFDSPYKQEFTVNGKLVMKQVNLIASADTLAYYWRVRLAQAAANESSDWAMTSFTYIKDGNEGWAQVHFPQYNSNETIGLVKDTEGRKLQLKETVTDVSIQTFGSNHPGYVTFSNPYFTRTYHPELSVKVAGTEYHPLSLIESAQLLACRKDAINLIAFNKTTGLPYMPIDFQYPDPHACGRRPEIITNFMYWDVVTGNSDMIQYINNVTVGDSVILFSLGTPGYSSWPAAAFTKLEELGIASSQITGLLAGEPVIIYARKGAAPGTAVVKRTSATPAEAQPLYEEATITGRYTSGEMKSSRIGPATAWKKIAFAAAISELPQTDQFTFDVIRISMDGTEDAWQEGITAAEVDLSGLDAQQYPYLQLVFHATDEINLTSPQLTNWIVEYTPAPEGVLTYSGTTASQSLHEGELFTNSYGFLNISDKFFSDSLQVQYTVYNTTRKTSDVRTKKIPAPAPGAETIFDLTYHTENNPGLNDVRVFVNPHTLPELYYDNNELLLADFLKVQADIFNPVLDVTIDGRYVTDGDFVSANPKIIIDVWDENPVTFISDTTGVKIFLTYPDAQQPTPVYFKRNDVQWFSATSVSNFRVQFLPDLPEGTYRLQIQAVDTKGNTGGAEPYAVSFVVLADQSVVIAKPYPNPSAGDVYFEVMLTGDEHPDTMWLEIMNANGQTVTTFTKHDLFVGTNVLMWHRQNVSGGIVPEGMYLYRMILTRGGAPVKTATGKIMIR